MNVRYLFHALGFGIALSSIIFMIWTFLIIIWKGSVGYYEPIKAIIYSEFILACFGLFYMLFILRKIRSGRLVYER